ncbi:MULTISPECIES: hypothetical protein [Methylorubrum]|uniref:hypothetical protein n=1 Tax=Methylorubrum TaxID=2282523 RepID=UPI00209D100A|nr:hypothetical protein [Methylorubrum zatmanii]MCP1551709.1 hypothetical protein [Methylorubrum extorquens]MCP1577315.1 hypothetical protein [Methylorubrum extorquens]
MASLNTTLDIFSALLASEQPVPVGEADEAIWAYLAAFGGLDAQVRALDRLAQGVAGLDATSAFMSSLRDALDRHRARLAEPSA